MLSCITHNTILSVIKCVISVGKQTSSCRFFLAYTGCKVTSAERERQKQRRREQYKQTSAWARYGNWMKRDTHRSHFPHALICSLREDLVDKKISPSPAVQHQFLGGFGRQTKQNWRLWFEDVWVHSETAEHSPFAHLDHHRVCAWNNCAFSFALFHQRHLDKQPPTLIPGVNVLCTSGWRKPPLTVPIALNHQAVRAWAPRCKTSFNKARHNASWATSSMQMNGTPAQ